MKLFLLILIFNYFLFPQQKPKLLWFDATANFKTLSFEDSIYYYLNKAKEIGFTDVVLDIKPITGEVLYESEIAPQMKEWNGFVRKNNFDFVNTFIEAAKSFELQIHVSLNVFVAGHNYHDRGIVYNGKSEWQSINYTDSGFVPITKLKHKYSAMTNPVNKEVQEYELNIIKEIVKKFPGFEGIFLDRVRFDGIEADFSELSKNNFEKYINTKINNYPADIYEWTKDEKGNKKRTEGKYYKQWLEWRASIIYDFMKTAKEEIKNINPNIKFGVYTGAWYPVYYDVGVNWASKNYDPSLEYDWATPDYKNYGYAELLEIYSSGCYFYEVTKEEVLLLNEKEIKRNEAGMGIEKEEWYSVEGSAEIAMKVINGAVPVLGSLYVEQYKDNPEQFIKAIKMCLEKTDGLMIFDIVHIINYNWWEYLKEGIN